ncbi:hypothetical protein OXX69_013132 [Metschnikowia pulcherrima]
MQPSSFVASALKSAFVCWVASVVTYLTPSFLAITERVGCGMAQWAKLQDVDNPNPHVVLIWDRLVRGNLRKFVKLGSEAFFVIPVFVQKGFSSDLQSFGFWCMQNLAVFLKEVNILLESLHHFFTFEVIQVMLNVCFEAIRD